MRRGKAHALQALDLAAGSQKLGKRLSIAEAHAVRIDVLAQKSYLDGALGDDGFDFGEDLPGPSVAFLASEMRHDAERAGVVAPDGDRHPRCKCALAAGGKSRREHLERFLYLDRGLGVVPRTLEECWKDVEIVGAEHSVDPRRFLDDPAAHLLRQAAADGDLHARPLAFDRCQLAEIAEKAGRRVFPHAACVDDDDVSAFVPRIRRPCSLFGHDGDGDIAGVLKEAGQALGVVHIHLASERANCVRTREFNS